MSGTKPTTAVLMNQRFAAVQSWGMRLGLALMLSGFAAYLSGWLPGIVPLERLTALLGVEASVFVTRNGIPTGWAWLTRLERGDMLSLGGLLALVSVVGLAYGSLIPTLLRRRDWIYVVLVLAQLAVFALAASGWLAIGGH